MSTIDHNTVAKDVDAMFTSAQLCTMIRFAHKRFWEEETLEDTYCERVRDGKPRFESVADHSWHLADCVLLIGPKFPEIDLARALMLAIIHDKLEIWTQDASPLGRDGSGAKTFAFDRARRDRRAEQERDAADVYLGTLSVGTRVFQKALINELLLDRSASARFVRALDKLQVFVYLIRRKAGKMADAHIEFNLRYARKYTDLVPGLNVYYDELVSRLLVNVATERQMNVAELREQFRAALDPPQLEFRF